MFTGYSCDVLPSCQLWLPGVFVLELGRGTRQTDGQTDKHRPSFHNARWRSGHNNAHYHNYRAS